MEINLGEDLLRAAGEGDAKRVRELLRCEGIDVQYYEERDAWGPRTALVAACMKGHAKVALLLLKRGGETQEEVETAFCWTATTGLVDITKILMERGADPSTRDNLAIGWAAHDGRVDIVKLLLQDERVDPSARDNYAIRYAIANRHVDIVKLLMSDPRVNPVAIDNLAIRHAARKGYCDMLEVLLVDPRVDGTCAIPVVHSSAVQVLLEDERCGIHVNRALFLEHRPLSVERYDSFDKQRNTKKWTALWCMKEIGEGWEEIMWPFSDRFEKISIKFERDISVGVERILYRNDVSL